MSDQDAEHVMLDLETLGVAPGCVVMSIGAVRFTYDGVLEGKTFHQVININSAKSVELTVDPATEEWWRKQPLAAQEVLLKAEGTVEARHISLVLSDFAAWLGDRVRVWGNGADFDQPLLAACYAAIGRRVPWKYYHSRCYRTLKALVDLPLVRVGLHHDALDDARTQAAHAVKILQHLFKPPVTFGAPGLRAEDGEEPPLGRVVEPVTLPKETLALAQAGTLAGGHRAGR